MAGNVHWIRVKTAINESNSTNQCAVCGSKHFLKVQFANLKLAEGKLPDTVRVDTIVGAAGLLVD
jgi:hypothetical protein